MSREDGGRDHGLCEACSSAPCMCRRQASSSVVAGSEHFPDFRGDPASVTETEPCSSCWASPGQAHDMDCNSNARHRKPAPTAEVSWGAPANPPSAYPKTAPIAEAPERVTQEEIADNKHGKDIFGDAWLLARCETDLPEMKPTWTQRREAAQRILFGPSPRERRAQQEQLEREVVELREEVELWRNNIAPFKDAQEETLREGLARVQADRDSLRAKLSEAERKLDDRSVLDSHVVELIELLKYDGRANLVADVPLTGETLERYAGRTAEAVKEPTGGEPATHVFDNVCRCLANVGGALCVVEVTITPHDDLPPGPATRI